MLTMKLWLFDVLTITSIATVIKILVLFLVATGGVSGTNSNEFQIAGCMRLPVKVQPHASRWLHMWSSTLRIDVKRSRLLNAQVQLVFEPELLSGRDYSLHIPGHSLPPPFVSTSLSEGVAQLTLNLNLSTSASSGLFASDGQPLFLLGVFSCPSYPEARAVVNLSNGTDVQRVQVARMSSAQSAHALNLPVLPGLGPKIIALLASLERLPPLVLMADSISASHLRSMQLLHLHPPVLLVDATRVSLEEGAAAVDAFLAKHSVLEVVYEPFSADEPRWWVLVPHAVGVPGSFFAALDIVQNRPQPQPPSRPTVADCAKDGSLPGCSGCPNTFLVKMQPWGYGYVVQAVARAAAFAVQSNQPFQLTPIILSSSNFVKDPASMQGRLGWQYTHGGCASDFLDCFFLPHSPCPPVLLDSDSHHINASRHIFSVEKTFDGNLLKGIFATAAASSSLYHRDAVATEARWDQGPILHVFKAYFLRPKYSVRRAIFQHAREMRLGEQPCAALHVRRGDVIFQNSGPGTRGYLHIHQYMQAARELLDLLQIRVIFLLTDSQSAVDEANACAAAHPALCGGIEFRYIQKKRWVAAEGGLEKHIPPGSSPSEELGYILAEMGLVQQCQLTIGSNSQYSEMMKGYAACKTPGMSRGHLPGPCKYVPHIRIDQAGFDCAHGNKFECNLSSHATTTDESVAYMNHSYSIIYEYGDHVESISSNKFDAPKSIDTRQLFYKSIHL